MQEITPDESLGSRTKGKRLKYEEKIEIYNKLRQGTPIREKKNCTKLAFQQFNRIIDNNGSRNDFDRTPHKIKCRDIENRRLFKAIISYIEQTQELFTWTNIRDHLINKEGIQIDRNTIRRILIEKLNYSFKRWSPRPLKHNRKISKLRFYFLWKYAKCFTSLPYWSTLMSLHFLLPQSQTIRGVRGQPSNLSSIIFKGSISIISAIMSNEMSVTGIRIGTIKSKIFIKYIRHLLLICEKQ